MKNLDLLVVGAGASGLLASGIAAEQGMQVTVLEKMNQVGRKLSITGKGRCNLSNQLEIADFIDQIEPMGHFLWSSLSRFSSTDLIELLERIGIPSKLERGGRYFPKSDSAPEVTHKLYAWCTKNGVKFVRNFQVNRLIVGQNKVRGVQGIVLKNNAQSIESYTSDHVMICTGGMSYPATGSTGEGHKMLREVGHTVSQCLPSLVPLEIDPQLAMDLAGLDLKNVSVALSRGKKVFAQEFGELSFIRTGISGPIILTISRIAVPLLKTHKQLDLSIDFKPALDTNKLDQRLIRDFQTRGTEPLSSILRGLMPQKLVQVCLRSTKLMGHTLGAMITAEERKRLLAFLKSFEIKILGHRPFQEAIITKGGISTDEIDQATMESKLVKGLYVVGEILDLDGPTGGFNLQIAFSTGFAAAQACIERYQGASNSRQTQT